MEALERGFEVFEQNKDNLLAECPWPFRCHRGGQDSEKALRQLQRRT